MLTLRQYLAGALSLAVATAFGLLLNSCSESSSPSTNGTVTMYMSDAPTSFDSVVIVVSRVEVHLANADTTSGWTVVRSDSARYDLLTLRNGARGLLGTQSVVAGHYTQIRLILSEGSYVVDNGVKHPLTIPSGIQTGVKLNTPFDIVAGQTYELQLDFDAEKSIHVTGNDVYMMNPVIRVFEVAATGSVKGVVLPTAARARVWTTVGIDTVATGADTVSGAFKLVGLTTGVFAIHCDHTAGTYGDTVIQGVAVTAPLESNIDTVRLH